MSKLHLHWLAPSLLCAAVAWAQQSSTPALSSHPEPVAAGEGVIKLDVVVTGKSGEPVSGLGLGDFTLLDNRQPAKILSFRAIDGTAQMAEPPVEVILLMDELNVGAVGIALEQNNLQKYLRQNDGRLALPVSLSVLTDKGLNSLSGPSVDGNALAAVASQLDNRLRAINTSAGNWGLDERFTLSLRALEAVAHNETKKPGKKLLIWIGAGWPTFDLRALPASSRRQQEGFGWIVRLSRELREARISVFATGTSLEYERFLEGVKKAEEANFADLQLEVLAVQSGGKVLTSARDKDLAAQIDRCIQDASAYYTLSFDPPPAGYANEYHELKLRVDKPGLTARTNTGYYNQPEAKPDAASNRPSADLDADHMPDSAARPVTVEELERALKELQGEPDAKAAKQLSAHALTERLSSAKLSALKAGLPGVKAQQALVALADASVFLNPPAAEIPAGAPPDLAAQRRMMAQTIDYLAKTIPKLPDFFAARVTAHYEESPPKSWKPGRNAPGAGPLHLTNTSSVNMLFRGGHDLVVAEAAKGKKPTPNEQRLFTRGTFGEILSVVIEDAPGGRLTWSRWELGAGGPEAVFRFAVPRKNSHYIVLGGSSSFSAGIDELQPPTAYHGEIAIDPAAGTILRLVMEADPEPGSPIVRAGVMVEYGPVEIGGKTYFCPVRSVSISRGLASYRFDSEGRQVPGPALTMLNDVAFTGYHMFRSEVRMLSGSNPELEEK